MVCSIPSSFSFFCYSTVVSLIPCCRIELGNEVKRGRESKLIFLRREFYNFVFILLISSYNCRYVAALKKLEFWELLLWNFGIKIFLGKQFEFLLVLNDVRIVNLLWPEPAKGAQILEVFLYDLWRCKQLVMFDLVWIWSKNMYNFMLSIYNTRKWKVGLAIQQKG